MTAIRSAHDCPTHRIPLVLDEDWTGLVAWRCPRCVVVDARRVRWQGTLLLVLFLVGCAAAEALIGVRA